MAIVRIIRSNEYANRLRDIKIFLDGTELGKIGNAQTKDFEVMSGDHMLQAKIDWCSSNKVTFSISDNEIISFNMDSFAKHNSIGILATIYYITFGANRYLNLKEVTL
jgi:hypothetical protein